MNVNESVLDHPIEKQREYAALFKMTLEEWRAHMIKGTEEADALRAELDANPVRFEDLSPEEQEWARRFQARVDDEVLTSAVLSRRAEEARRNT
ncbi:MAG: hypothetical protein JSR65_10185 [Proteobacteria bacterium]|nr:hypothetical protein [Pseudomonadota bacterium]